MEADYDFALNPTARASLHLVGDEQEPVLMVNGLMRRPEALVDYAAEEVSFAPAGNPQGGYPGVRALAPLNYVQSVVKAMDPLVRQAFGLDRVRLARAECNFSIVTTAPDALTPSQRIPHVDTLDPLQFAFLHYLCDERFGGTAFYRHRETGFERVIGERSQIYSDAQRRQLDSLEPGSGYIVGSNAQYEQIAAFTAAFDRLLIYRSCLLHSGQIQPGMALDPDPRKGRLTANIFVNYAPR